jgi:hypothetical protein
MVVANAQASMFETETPVAIIMQGPSPSYEITHLFIVADLGLNINFLLRRDVRPLLGIQTSGLAVQFPQDPPKPEATDDVSITKDNSPVNVNWHECGVTLYKDNVNKSEVSTYSSCYSKLLKDKLSPQLQYNEQLSGFCTMQESVVFVDTGTNNTPSLTYSIHFVQQRKALQRSDLSNLPGYS